MGKFDDPPPIEPHHWPAGVTKEKPKVVAFKKPNGEDKTLPIPVGESAFSLVERELPEPVKLCDPWAVEGVNIVAGRPKLGKTTLERQKLAAAATGGEYLDSKFVNPTKCAFLSLEEGELLARSKLRSASFPEAALTGIQLFFEWPRGEVGADLLDRYLTLNADVRLVVIDSLTRFRNLPDPKSPAFMADYDAINLLHEVSKKHPGVVLDVVHHTRKVRSDDPIDDVSGTYGLTAAADCITVLRSQGQAVVMYVYGRMWAREDNQYSLKRNAKYGWDMLGVHLDITEAQKDALERVRNAVGGFSGSELAETLGITKQSAWQRLDELLEKGLVTKIHGRVYAK